MMMRRLLILIFVMFNTMVIPEVAMCECREEGFSPIHGFQIFGVFKRECTFTTIAEFRKAPELKEIETQLNKDANKIPESYYF